MIGLSVEQKVVMRNESGLMANYMDLIVEVWFGVILYSFE